MTLETTASRSGRGFAGVATVQLPGGCEFLHSDRTLTQPRTMNERMIMAHGWRRKTAAVQTADFELLSFSEPLQDFPSLRTAH